MAVTASVSTPRLSHACPEEAGVHLHHRQDRREREAPDAHRDREGHHPRQGGNHRRGRARGRRHYGTTLRILSSPSRTLPRPSRLLVVTYSAPSGPTTTSRSRPWTRRRIERTFTSLRSASSVSWISRSPRSAAIQRLSPSQAMPDGAHVSRSDSPMGSP